MKKILAIAAIISVISETPSCGKSKGGGSGDLNHPNIVASTQAKHDNQRPYRTKPAGNRHVIKFEVLARPLRRITITWGITNPNRGNIEVLEGSRWIRIDQSAAPGSYAFLKVENHGKGGYLSCAIYIDDLLLVPKESDMWTSFEQRNDAGDCNADVIVP